MYGLRDFEHADKIAGVVSLGTPFFHCVPHNRPKPPASGNGSRVLVWSAVVPLALFAMNSRPASDLLLDFAMGPGWGLEHFTYTGSGLAVVSVAWLLGTLALWLYVFAVPQGPIVRHAAKAQAEMLKQFRPPNDLDVPFYCVRARGDEARSGLIVNYVITTVPDRLEHFVAFLGRIRGAFLIISSASSSSSLRFGRGL